MQCAEIILSNKIKLQIDTSHSCNLYENQYQTLTTSVPFDVKLGCLLKNSIGKNKVLDSYIREKKALGIFTDGSKMLNAPSTGAACICPDLNIQIQKSISTKASVYTAECIALECALEIALENSEYDFLIFSDSLSVLQSIQTPSSGNILINKYIHSIKKKYNNFKEAHKDKYIKFHWVPSHEGIRGNEEVDSLAKEASLRMNVDISTCPFTDIYEYFKQECKKSSVEKLKPLGDKKGTSYFNIQKK